MGSTWGAGMQQLKRSCAADVRYLERLYSGTEAQLGGGWRMCVTYERWYSGTEAQLCGRCAGGTLVRWCSGTEAQLVGGGSAVPGTLAFGS